MVRQSLTMQQNFNADELEEEKELSDDRLEDNVIYDWQADRDWYDHEADQDFHDDFLNVEMAVYSE